MLDFRPSARSRSLPPPRHRRRVFAWVMGFGLLLIAAANFPRALHLLRSSQTSATAVDTRFRPPPDTSSLPGAVTLLPPESPSLAPPPALAGIDRTALGAVRDDTPYIRPAESAAWFDVWKALQKLSPAQAAQLPSREVSYVELFDQPGAFRGQWVTVRGSARWAERRPAAPNDAKIGGYYQLGLWPAGGPAEPIFIYCLELPPGFPTGDNIAIDVNATGLFFKRMVYPSREPDVLRRAPLIMCQTVELQNASLPPTTPMSADAAWIVGLLFAGLLLASLLAGGLLYHRFRARSLASTANHAPASTPDFSALADRVLPPPSADGPSPAGP